MNQQSMPSFSDLIALANHPGPMQGMAVALLRQMSDESAATDARTERTGMRASPGNGPAGLNFGAPTPGHANYSAALAQDLVERYGMSANAPRGEGEPDISPSPEAEARYKSAMEEFEPSMWEKIKQIASAIGDDPSLVTEPVGDIAAYATPMIGNSKGVQDLQSYWGEMERYAANPRTDAFDVLRNYGPGIAMDTAQSLLPLGWRSGAEKGGGGLMAMLRKYGLSGGRRTMPDIMSAYRSMQ